MVLRGSEGREFLLRPRRLSGRGGLSPATVMVTVTGLAVPLKAFPSAPSSLESTTLPFDLC